MDRHLGRVRPGDEVRHAEQVQEALVADPPPAPHDLVTHEGDVRRGASKTHGAQLQEDGRDLQEPGSGWPAG